MRTIRKHTPSGPKPKTKKPQRTCLACRKVKEKRELIRLVRVSDGTVEIDAGEGKSGRGAYLCRSQECWEAGLVSSNIGHVLRTTLTRDNLEKLNRYKTEIFQGVS